jgi:excisionase family DNA binding protein
VSKLTGDRAFYTVKEAAEEVRCSVRTMYKYTADGTIAAKKGPTGRLIPRDALQAFMDSFPDVEGALWLQTISHQLMGCAQTPSGYSVIPHHNQECVQ